MHSKTCLVFIVASLLSCNDNQPGIHDFSIKDSALLKTKGIFNPYPSIAYIPTPTTFTRLKVDSKSFASGY